jgi:2'-5' RNA ligase
MNSFALVSYLPDPLGSYLSELRAELVPGCAALSHVTLLPPRPLADPALAWKQAVTALSDFHPFEIELGPVEVFPVTNVIYLAVLKGFRNLIEMHDALNRGAMHFAEPYKYHPHVTLAQELEAGQHAPVLARAQAAWEAFPHRRSYVVDPLYFVQNTIAPESGQSTWLDLERHSLAQAAVRIA